MNLESNFEQTKKCSNDLETNTLKVTTDTTQNSYGRQALTAFLLALYYVILCGLGFPEGFQVPLFIIPFNILLSKNLGKNAPSTNCYLLISSIFSFFFAVYSNQNVHILAWLIILFFISFSLLKFNTNFNFEENILSFFYYLKKYCFFIIKEYFHNLFCIFIIYKNFRKIKFFNKIILYKIIISFSLTIFFSLFFSSVNETYLYLFRDFMVVLSTVYHYLVDLNFIIIFFKTFFLTPLFFSIYINNDIKENDIEPSLIDDNSEERKKIFLNIISSSIIPVSACFLIFICLQSEYIFVTISNWTYKELALYVHHGFFELLLIALFGAILYFQYRKEYLNSKKKFLFTCLTIFTIELILTSILTLHKTSLQPFYFGLRDLRIFAISGTVLITISFVAYLFELFNKISMKDIFKIQYIALTVVIGFLNFIPVDYFITVINPLKYKVNKDMYKDYSYLLTNSEDNYTEWYDLMEEYIKETPPSPYDDYYWGAYRSLESNFFKSYIRTGDGTKAVVYDIEDFASVHECKESFLKQNLMKVLACKSINNNTELTKKFVLKMIPQYHKRNYIQKVFQDYEIKYKWHS